MDDEDVDVDGQTAADGGIEVGGADGGTSDEERGVIWLVWAVRRGRFDGCSLECSEDVFAGSGVRL